MKYLKYIFISAMAMFALVACDPQVDPYTPGQPTNTNGDNVYFAAENPGTYVLGLSDNSFVVAIERDPVDHAVTVPLTVHTSTPEVFTVPASVTFEAGQTSAEITVGFNNAEPFTNYQLEIVVDEELTHQYAEQYVYPRFAAIVLQEDYKVVHTGVYYDDFWSGAETEQDLEYSEMQDLYRLSNVWGTGVGFTFAFNPDAEKEEDIVTKLPGALATGLFDDTYGYITATADASQTFYEPDEDAIYFAFKWTVSAGSFGVYYNVFYF